MSTQFPALSVSAVATTPTTFAVPERTFTLKSSHPRYILAPMQSFADMAACCAGCNGLKNEFLPPASHPCWKSRKTFIKECSRFVAECRLKNFQKYKTHVEAVLKKRAGQ